MTWPEKTAKQQEKGVWRGESSSRSNYTPWWPVNRWKHSFMSTALDVNSGTERHLVQLQTCWQMCRGSSFHHHVPVPPHQRSLVGAPNNITVTNFATLKKCFRKLKYGGVCCRLLQHFTEGPQLTPRVPADRVFFTRPERCFCQSWSWVCRWMDPSVCMCLLL